MKKLPLYFKEYYAKIYENTKISKFFDDNLVINLLRCGQNRKLINALNKEIKEGDKVLQLGATFGPQIDLTAQEIGSQGQYDILDISKFQLKRVREKYKYIHLNLKFINQDAADEVADKYDVVICNMLLHEVPLATKSKIINQALSAITPKGKVVFIEYHNPLSWFPLRYFMRIINRLYQPFAEKIWDRELDTYAINKLNYSWKKSTYFYRCFQKVVVKPKSK